MFSWICHDMSKQFQAAAEARHADLVPDMGTCRGSQDSVRGCCATESADISGANGSCWSPVPFVNELLVARAARIFLLRWDVSSYHSFSDTQRQGADLALQ